MKNERVNSSTGAGAVGGMSFEGVAPPARTEAPTTLMPEPAAQASGCGDPVAELAQLLAQLTQAQRKSAREAEQAASAAQTRNEAAKVAEMRDKAGSSLIAGVTDGVLSIGVGACTLGSGLSSGKGDELRKTLFDAGGKAHEGASKIVAVNFKYNAELHDVAATEYGNAANAAERSSKAAHEDGLDARDLFKKAVEFLKEMRAAKDNAMSTAARRA